MASNLFKLISNQEHAVLPGKMSLIFLKLNTDFNRRDKKVLHSNLHVF